MTRTRELYSTDELPVVWETQSQSSGHTRDNRMHFTERTIYSYGSHFPMARIFDAPNGKQIVLFTNRTYSPTTARHIRAVQRALNRSHRRVVYCEFVDTLQGSANLLAFQQDFEAVAGKHAKARVDSTKRTYASYIYKHARQAKIYCEVMCLPVPLWATIPEGIDYGDALKAALIIYKEPADEKLYI